MRGDVLCVPGVISLTLCWPGRALCASACTGSLSSWLVAVVDDERRLIHVQVGRCGRVVQIVIGVQRGRVLRIVGIIDLLVALAEGLG